MCVWGGQLGAGGASGRRRGWVRACGGRSARSRRGRGPTWEPVLPAPLADALHGGVGEAVVGLACVATPTAHRGEGHEVVQLGARLTGHPVGAGVTPGPAAPARPLLNRPCLCGASALPREPRGLDPSPWSTCGRHGERRRTPSGARGPGEGRAAPTCPGAGCHCTWACSRPGRARASDSPASRPSGPGERRPQRCPAAPGAPPATEPTHHGQIEDASDRPQLRGLGDEAPGPVQGAGVAGGH